jgi:uncharacterized integral membrane protein
MGEKAVFQPLTREDRITVVLYRAGIVLAALIVTGLAAVLGTASSGAVNPAVDVLGYGLYLSVGLSVFFIHLYISKFHRFLKKLYYLSLVCLGILLYLGKGSLAVALAGAPYSQLLLLPLSGCLGFITAKEAFCFRLFEGYLLALIMPIYLLLLALNAPGQAGATAGLALIAAMLLIFTARKVFMPIAYDIGDKSAYQ